MKTDRNVFKNNRVALLLLLIVMSAIDNLVKGASGQAVQNMNIMIGCPETTALAMAPLYP